MSPLEHYFENILNAYIKTGDFKTALKDDDNTQYLSKEEIDAVRTCAEYIIITACDCNREKLAEFTGMDGCAWHHYDGEGNLINKG